MSKTNSTYGAIVAGLIWCIAVCFVLKIPAQHEFDLILSGLIPAFISYAWLASRPWKQKLLLYAVLIGCIARVWALFCFPQLSDDIYRFIWDGLLWHEGINAYSILPQQVTQQLSHHDQLLALMNSPEYYTVYPSISQLFFYCASIFDGSIFGMSVALKFIFLLCELLTLFYALRILRHLALSPYYILLYWLNPLIVIEGIGNLHLEMLMIPFLAMGMYAYYQGHLMRAMLYLAISVGVKLLTLLIVPFLLLRIEGIRRYQAAGLFSLIMIVIFWPIFQGLHIAEFLSSIDLYFRKFEFNASVYYLLRYVGQLISGYNLIAYIGPLLGLLFIAYYFKRLWVNDSNIWKSFLLVLIVYYILATTVHPWYMSLLIFSSIFVRNISIPSWSALIMLTYINYSYNPYHENLWIVALEYILLLGIILWEMTNSRLVLDKA